jgi:hypothetical protein
MVCNDDRLFGYLYFYFSFPEGLWISITTMLFFCWNYRREIAFCAGEFGIKLACQWIDLMIEYRKELILLY